MGTQKKELVGMKTVLGFGPDLSLPGQDSRWSHEGVGGVIIPPMQQYLLRVLGRKHGGGSIGVS